MSILIKGMEMPKDCCDCKFCTRKELSQCILTGGFTNWEYYNGARRADCPLVPVPTPHGRLIDADVLNTDDMIESWINGDLYRHEWSIDEWINTAPTIIEAEEE